MRSGERWLLALVGLVSLAALANGLLVQGRVTSLRNQVARLRNDITGVKDRQGELGEQFDNLGTLATLYFLRETPTALQLGTERRRLLGSDLPTQALTELVKGPSPGSKLQPVLPKDTLVNSVKVRGGVAYADLGGSASHLNVGSEGEADIVSAIVATLTQFPGIAKVQILIDGVKVESLAGHVDVSAPLGRSETLVQQH